MKIEQISVTKLLGVQIDSNLNWASQFESVCRKLSQRLGILKRIRDLVPKEVAIRLFNALVLPHMDYCCTVWGRPSNRNFIDRVTKLQKRAARIILQCKISDYSSSQLFQMLKWMPFEERVSFKRCLLMYKCINGLTPVYLQTFRYMSQHHTYNTRSVSRNNVVPSRAKLSTVARCFRFEGERLWNSLPVEMRTAKSPQDFKRMYCKNYFNKVVNV